jgi:hypothetical protein
MADADVTRREVLTKAVYMTPAIVTLPVLLSFASAGSGHPSTYAAGSGTPGDYAAGSGTPGDDGDDGRQRRWQRGKPLGWVRGRHYGWERAPGQ